MYLKMYLPYEHMSTNLNDQHLLTQHILHLLPCLGGAKSLLWVSPLLLSPSIVGCSYNAVSVLGQLLNLLSSILTILLSCPNSDTLLSYSNDLFLTVYVIG